MYRVAIWRGVEVRKLAQASACAPRDKMVWEKVARYDYYKHGPLATIITGQQQIQYVTNAYTLQGWIKGTVPDANASNTLIAKSAYSYGLGYFAGDYKAIDGSDMFASVNIPSGAVAKNLYNGNISAMLINLPKIGEPVLHTYKYDQLNRIKEVNNYNSYNAANQSWQATTEHKETLTFDANGNIQTALLNGNSAQLAYENYNYNYDAVKKNRLLSIINSVNNTTSNYEYDEIGNVTKDELEGNASMEWNLYGKLTRLVKDNGTEIDFKYDAAGNRISKTVAGSQSSMAEFYVRDAGGNIMATYRKDPAKNKGKLSTEAFYLYGSNMLGAWKHAVNMESGPIPEAITYFKRGEQEFYFGNQLGNNVLILSDKKTGFDDNGDGITDRYQADVLSATDYSAYGENLKGREFKSSLIQFGFNGKWNDNETGYQDYGMRMYSGRRRGFVSVDPLTGSYPWYSPYEFAGNMPLTAIDLDGLEPKTMIDASGKLTQPMITVLNAAFGFSKTSLKNSTWVSYKSKEGRLWAKVVGIPSTTSSSVEGNTVVHDDDQNRSDVAWFGLIGHEQSHRQDVENNPLFYEDYLIQGAISGYKGIATERKAYKYGGDWGKSNDYSDQLLRYQDGIIMKTLNNNLLSDGSKSEILESAGNKFKRDVILNDKLRDLQTQARRLKNSTKSLEGNRLKKVMNWYMITENNYELKKVNQQISDVKNEQEKITSTYGK